MHKLCCLVLLHHYQPSIKSKYAFFRDFRRSNTLQLIINNHPSPERHSKSSKFNLLAWMLPGPSTLRQRSRVLCTTYFSLHSICIGCLVNLKHTLTTGTLWKCAIELARFILCLIWTITFHSQEAGCKKKERLSHMLCNFKFVFGVYCAQGNIDCLLCPQVCLWTFLSYVKNILSIV